MEGWKDVLARYRGFRNEARQHPHGRIMTTPHHHHHPYNNMIHNIVVETMVDLRAFLE
jgi:hypothetical protein